MYDSILVGTDGSKHADKAVERAIQLAKEHDASLHALTAVNTKRYGEPALSSRELVLNELEERGAEQLDAIIEQAENATVEVTTVCPRGDPTEELLRYAEEIDADVIVLGTKGRTHVASKIGSTANRVIRQSERDVLLV